MCLSYLQRLASSRWQTCCFLLRPLSVVAAFGVLCARVPVLTSAVFTSCVPAPSAAHREHHNLLWWWQFLTRCLCAGTLTRRTPRVQSADSVSSACWGTIPFFGVQNQTLISTSVSSRKSFRVPDRVTAGQLVPKDALRDSLKSLTNNPEELPPPASFPSSSGRVFYLLTDDTQSVKLASPFGSLCALA